MARPTSRLDSVARGARALLAANAVPEFAKGFVKALSAFGGYEAAKPSRVRHDWTTRNAGPNTTVQAAAPNLVARSRDLARNDAHWSKDLELFAVEMVGTGIVPRAVQPPRRDGSTAPRPRTELQDQADDAWAWWCGPGVADIEGRHSLYSLSRLACVAWRRDGAVFAQRVWDRDPTRPVPMRLRLLERDMLDTSKSGATASGGKIHCGIQVGPQGRVEGYWFRQSHPGENIFGTPIGSVFVPASDVVHLYTPERVGQLDGVPHGAPSMTRKRDLNAYENAELTRKETEAMTAIIVTAPPIADAIGSLETDEKTGEQYGITPTVVNANGEAVGDLRPGAVLTVENGGNVTSLQPTPTAYYPEYKKAMVREIAAGLFDTYESLSGDLEGVNYTSYRAGHLKRDAYIDAKLWLEFIPLFKQRLWVWCMEAAYLRGTVSALEVPVEWSPPKRVSVDPEKDAIADIIEERAGYALHDDNVAKRGHDPSTFYERRRAENELFDEGKGLTFDSDPRKYAFRGAFPPAVQGTSIAGDNKDAINGEPKGEE